MRVSLKSTSLLTVLVLVSTVFAVACGGGGDAAGGGGEAPVATATADVAAAGVSEGHELFKTTCAVCHGQNGEGMPALGKNLNGNEFIQSNSDEQLVAFMIEGRPATHPDNTRGVDMPPRGGNPTITDEELAKIVTYLRSLQ